MTDEAKLLRIAKILEKPFRELREELGLSEEEWHHLCLEAWIMKKGEAIFMDGMKIYVSGKESLKWGDINEAKIILNEFADWLDTQQPSPAQMGISPDYNTAVIRTLEWVAKQLREKANARNP